MKWPNTLTLVRHGESAYNKNKKLKEADPLYREFVTAFESEGKNSERSVKLAREILEHATYILECGDHDTPLTELGKRQSRETGVGLSGLIPLPDVVMVSPYDRTDGTYDGLCEGWPELGDVKKIHDDRIVEQDHGLQLAYGDWRIFQALHPDQAALRARQGAYWYRYPQGENVPDVRERNRSIAITFTRDYSEQNVLEVTHHLNILAFRANMERRDAAGFIELDEEHKPINCGVSVWRGYPELGKDGKLLLDIYNKKLYDD